MKEVAGSLPDWRRVGATLSGVVTILCAIILLLPDESLIEIGLLEAKEANLSWIGLILLVAVSIFLASLIESFWGWVRKKLGERELKLKLHNLPEDQKALLRELTKGDLGTVYRPLQHSAASYLHSIGVLIRTSNASIPGSNSFPYGLQPWARKILSNNRNLID